MTAKPVPSFFDHSKLYKAPQEFSTDRVFHTMLFKARNKGTKKGGLVRKGLLSPIIKLYVKKTLTVVVLLAAFLEESACVYHLAPPNLLVGENNKKIVKTTNYLPS